MHTIGMLAKVICGERGIRTPGPLQVNGFQDRRNRPLCHLSAAKLHFFIIYQIKFFKFFTVFWFKPTVH